MATTFHDIEGKLSWAHHLFVPDEYNGAKRWIVNFFPKDMAEWDALGLRLEKKTNDSAFPGEEYVRVRRDTEKYFRSSGETVQFEAPKVYLKDRSTPAPEDIRIGNGTKVRIRLAIFDAGRFKGHRLESVTILDLIEYERPMTETQAEEAKTEPTLKTNTKVKMPF